jgi:DNA recombination protein RmuC
MTNLVAILGWAVLVLGVAFGATALLWHKSLRRLEESRQELQAARIAEAKAQEHAASLEKDLVDQETLVQQRVRESFEALSGQALKSNNQAFLELAGQTIKPISDQLDSLRRRSEELDRVRKGEDEGLKTLLAGMRESQDRLRKETQSLANALRRSQVRGQWGEMVLEQLFQWAGLIPGVHYSRQVTVKGEEGDSLRPDFVVNLPGKRQVVIDSKTVLDAHLAAAQEEDPARRAEYLAQHARQLRDKVEALSRKAYWERFENAPEFVVLFLPADVFLDVALEQDQGLFERAFKAKIVLATPNTLMALLKVIDRSWKDAALAENALEIARQGRELMDRLVVFWEHLAEVGRSLEGASKAYNSSVASLQSRVYPATRRLLELEVSPSKAEWKKGLPKEAETMPRAMGSPPT